MLRIRRPFLATALCGAVLACAGLPAIAPASAHTQAQPIDAGPEPGDPVVRRKELNLEQARLAQEQLAANEASQAAHDQAVQSAQMQAQRDKAAYETAMEKHREVVAKYRADYAAWEQVVAACKRGDRTLCPPR
ncbi:MAG: hypothetical protein CMH85_15890 [Novosphingobium sp.]|nr:hypothetical protein [Novosphingobium sp.]